MIVPYINRNKVYYKNPAVQSMANGLSSYTRGRNYPYSTYQQVLNAIADQTTPVFNALDYQLNDRFPSTFRHNTMDVIYTAPYNENTVSIVGDGIQLERLSVDPETWWYNTLPSGLRVVETTNYSADILLYSTLEKQLLLHTPLTVPSTLFVSLNSTAGNFIDTENGSGITVVTIIGKDEFGNYQNEEFGFTFSGSIRSNKKWFYIEAVQCQAYDDPDKFLMSIRTYVDYGTQEFIIDPYSTRTTADKLEKTIFWNFTGGFLQHNEIAANSTSDYYAGIKDMNVFAAYKLKYVDDQGVLQNLDTIDSICISEKFIYVIKDGILLAYDKREVWPNIVKEAETARTIDPLVDLDIESEPGKLTIKGIYNRIRLDKRIVKYRFGVIDGNQVYELNTSGNIARDTFDSIEFIPNPLYDKIGFLTPTLTYESSFFENDLYIRLDILTDAGTTETDTYVIPRETKPPSFQLEIPDYTAGLQLFEDVHGYLCLGGNNKLIKYAFRNDTYIVDENTNNFVFAENYLSLSLTPFNTANALDQYGALHSLERILGEKNYDYYKRLQFAFFNKFDATRSGLVNAISTELNIPISTIFTVRSNLTVPVYFEILAPNIMNAQAGADVDINSIYYFNDTQTPTINSMKTYLEYLGFTVDVLNSSLLTLPANAILNFSNKRTFTNYSYEGRSEVYLPLEFDELIYSIMIDNFTKISSGATFDPVIKQFKVIDNRIVVANKQFARMDFFTFSSVSKNFYLKASPVIVSSIIDKPDMDFRYGFISEYARTTIEATENIHPTKWNN